MEKKMDNELETGFCSGLEALGFPKIRSPSWGPYTRGHVLGWGSMLGLVVAWAFHEGIVRRGVQALGFQILSWRFRALDCSPTTFIGLILASLKEPLQTPTPHKGC